MNQNNIPSATLPELFPGIDEHLDIKLSSNFFSIDNTFMPVALPFEALVLASITRFTAAKLVLEFRTARGRSTLLFASNCDASGEVYTVDLDKKYREDYTKASLHGDMDVGFMFRNSSVESKISMYTRGPGEGLPDSVTAKSGRFGQIFVDAAHDYDSVKFDTECALSVASDKAIILWHDFYLHLMHPGGVFDYLNELFLEKEIVLRHIIGTYLIVGSTSWDDNVPGEVIDNADPRLYYMSQRIFNADQPV